MTDTPTPSLDATEAFGAKGADAPRITLESLKDKIEESEFICPEFAPTLTICVLKLWNGFLVVGKSVPLSDENFDADKGETFAFEDAVRQMWQLEAYRAKSEAWALDTAVLDPDGA